MQFQCVVMQLHSKSAFWSVLLFMFVNGPCIDLIHRRTVGCGPEVEHICVNKPCSLAPEVIEQLIFMFHRV
jgi:hypothetical protein